MENVLTGSLVDKVRNHEIDNSDLGDVILMGRLVDYLGTVHDENATELLSLYPTHLHYEAKGNFTESDVDEDLGLATGEPKDKRFNVSYDILKSNISGVRAIWARNSKSWELTIYHGVHYFSITPRNKDHAHELQQKILQWLIS
jgi:hypothetical protein